MTARLAILAATIAFTACGGDDGERPATAAVPTATATATTAAPQPTAVAPTAAATVAPTTSPAIPPGAEGPECGEGEPAKAPPGELAILAGAKVYASEGANRFLAVIDGTATTDTRDAAARALEEAGFSLRSTGEEKDAAVAQLEGPDKTVEIQVAPLCAGKLRIAYTVS
jgi:hypothetical protein